MYPDERKYNNECVPPAVISLQTMTMAGLNQQLTDELRELTSDGLKRTLIPVNRQGKGRIAVAGVNFLNLSSNDYLGLAANRELIEKFYETLEPASLLDRFSPGASASRLMTGNSHLYAELENRLAGLYGRERALVFASGYHGNVGILPALAQKGDLILADKLCHASLIDGMRLSRADSLRYQHLDYDHLAHLLQEKRHRYKRVFLVSESVFSMDGDLADLDRLVALKKEFDAILYLDEAHGVGVYGPRGLGLAEKLETIQDIDILFGTFGKALGGMGGFAVCSEQVGDFLINRCRSFIFSTGLPPVCLHWLLFILDRLPAMNNERDHLLSLADDLRHELIRHGLTTLGASQIIPVIIGSNEQAILVTDRLREAGYWANAVRPPTVPPNTARLRLSLSSAFDMEELAPLPRLISNALG